MLIVCSPGHGSTEAGIFDPGAVGNRLRECDVTMDLCKRIKGSLSAYDVDFLVLPQVSLKERINTANLLKSDYYLSIHVNAGGGTGFESYTHPGSEGRTKEIQKIVHNAVMAYLSKLGVKDRGMKAANFQELRDTNMSALLLECLFIDTPADAEKLKDETFKNKLANEVAWGLVQAFGLLKRVGQDCNNCPKVNEIIIERDEIFAKASHLHQTIRQAQVVLSSV